MSVVRTCDLPDGALLGRYLQGGAYADCYVAEVAGAVTQAGYVEAFYTTAVFKIERRLLAWFAARPSTDLQAEELAAGRTDSFAIWRVEGRGADQLLLSDLRGRTRSWLMAAPVGEGGCARTRLYFGSAVVPVKDARSGRPRLGLPFRALLGFHKLYSRVLLGAAVFRLERARPRQPGA